MQSLDAETTTQSCRIKQTVRIIGKHVAVWLNCEVLRGIMNVSILVKYKPLNCTEELWNMFRCFYPAVKSLLLVPIFHKRFHLKLLLVDDVDFLP